MTLTYTLYLALQYIEILHNTANKSDYQIHDFNDTSTNIR